MSTTSSPSSGPNPPAAGSKDLPSGVITVTISKFRSIGSISPLEASLSGWTGFHMPAGRPMPQPAPTLAVNGDNVSISSKYPVRLSFSLPDPRYLLLGIAWESVNPNHQIGGEVFPEVVVRRGVHLVNPYQPPVTGGSCMTLTDNANLPGKFEYIILVQEAETGEIGVVDPNMGNDPPN